jgi:hypothetical protein
LFGHDLFGKTASHFLRIMPWIMDSIHRVHADLLLRDEQTTRSENLMQPAKAGSHRRAEMYPAATQMAHPKAMAVSQ